MPRLYSKFGPLFLYVVAALAAATLVLVWYFFVHNHLYEVVPGQMWRSAQLDAHELEAVAKDLSLRSVINLRGEHEELVWYQEERAVTEALGIKQINLKMRAYRLPEYDLLQDLVYQLDTVEPPFLVHCFYGIDRTGLASVVMLLLGGQKDVEAIRHEVSIWKGVRHASSAGKQFLRQYEAWLGLHDLPHTGSRFRHWVVADYRDGRTNVKRVSGSAVKSNNRITSFLAMTNSSEVP